MVSALPSSSGLGRSPPQAENIGSNPVGNADTTTLRSSSGLGRSPPQAENSGSNPLRSAKYTPAIRCPWSGVECDCKEFPWLVNEAMPQVCADIMKDKMPAMLAYRKVRK